MDFLVQNIPQTIPRIIHKYLPRGRNAAPQATFCSVPVSRKTGWNEGSSFGKRLQGPPPGQTGGGYLFRLPAGHGGWVMPRPYFRSSYGLSAAVCRPESA